MFSHSDKEASEDVYIEGLEIIRLYYKRHGIKIRVIRSDDFTTFKSMKVHANYAKYGVERQSSTPYQHWQSSVERDIHTMIHNISAFVHGSYLCEQNRGTEHSSTGLRSTTTYHDQPTSTHQMLLWTTTIKSTPSINIDLPSEISYVTHYQRRSADTSSTLRTNPDSTRGISKV
jgi:hypothetical protein